MMMMMMMMMMMNAKTRVNDRKDEGSEKEEQ